MNFPTLEQVETAGVVQLCQWYRFLPGPGLEVHVQVLNRINERVKELGGFTPEISKQIGWKAP